MGIRISFSVIYSLHKSLNQPQKTGANSQQPNSELLVPWIRFIHNLVPPPVKCVCMSGFSMLSNLTVRTSSEGCSGQLPDIQGPHLVCEEWSRVSYLVLCRTMLFWRGNMLENDVTEILSPLLLLFFCLFIFKIRHFRCTACNNAIAQGPWQSGTTTYCICHSHDFLGSGRTFHTPWNYQVFAWFYFVLQNGEKFFGPVAPVQLGSLVKLLTVKFIRKPSRFIN